MTANNNTLRTFYAIIATQTLSIVGSQLSGLAIGFYVFAQTGQATPLLLVGVFSMLPFIFASNIGGMLADRWDRRKLMLIADAGQALCSLLLLVSFASGTFQLWHLYVLTFTGRLLAAIQGPAFSASITMLVPENQRDRANALTQLSEPTAGVIAPILAGILYAAVGVVGTIFIDLATFLSSALVFIFVKIPQPAQTDAGREANSSAWKSFTSGLSFIYSRRPLFVMLLQATLINFCISGSMGMGMVYILSRTDSEATAGLIFGISSAAMLVGGVVLSIWGGTRPRIHTILPSVIFSGLCLSLFGLSQSPLAIGAAMIGLAAPLPWINAPLMSIIQAKTPPDLQGRVFAVLGQIAMLLTPVAYLLYGHLADNVLEPAVGTSAWTAFAPLLGSDKGAGMGLIFLVAGLVMAVSSALVYALPMIRSMEADLPDYVATSAPDVAAMPETAAAAGD